MITAKNYWEDSRGIDQDYIEKLAEISHALDLKDKYTGTHGKRVAEYAMRLAVRLGFPENEILEIGVGGLLHDAGKITLQNKILLNREEHLPEGMMDEVRRHPIVGAEILRRMNFSRPVTEYVLFHHEREDGSGYPFGLNKEEIPAGAKIISIADCFDAITTDRPYQKRKSLKCAFDILIEACETSLCEMYVEAFIIEIKTNGMIKHNAARNIEEMDFSLN